MMAGRKAHPFGGGPALSIPLGESANPAVRRLHMASADGKSLRTRMLEALAGEDWLDDGERVKAALENLADVSDHVGQAQAQMLATGRALIALQKTAGEGGYKKLHKAGLVPLSEPAASRLRVIAAMVDGGHLPEDRVPRDVTAAAMVVKEGPLTVERLVRQGVLRPDLTRREARELLAPKPVEKVGRGALTDFQRRQFKARLREIDREIAKLQAERERISRRLGDG